MDFINIFFLSFPESKMAKTKLTKRKLVKKEDKPFACHCGTRFIKRVYLNAHIRKFHGTQVEIPNSEQPSTSKAADHQPSTSKATDNQNWNLSDLEDWSDPEIELLDPVRDPESEGDEMENDNENDTDGEVICLGDESDVKEKSVSDKEDNVEETVTNLKENAEDEVVGVVNDSKEIMQKEDTRDIQKVYEGRTYCKPTQPSKVFAPKRKQEETVDEIIVNVSDSMKKRIVMRLPSGKQIKLDISME